MTTQLQRTIVSSALILFSTLSSFAQKELWGITSSGGANFEGVIFSYSSSSNSIDVKTSLNCQSRGYLIQASNGKLYGMTNCGGSIGAGIIFEYDIYSSTFQEKYGFDGSTNGGNPYGSLVEVSNGKLYGVAYNGGSFGNGVIFEFDPSSNTYSKKHDFNGVDGSFPYISLVQATNGNLYGFTTSGGTNDFGVIFEYEPTSGVFSKLYDFDGTNGSSPYGIVQATNGNLYGVTYSGGANNKGVIFEYNLSNEIYTKKFDFDGLNGENPYNGFFEASNGKLYGMTENGGANGWGVIFDFDYLTSSFTKVIDFDGVNGGYGKGFPIQASNGMLYGMTHNGGTDDYGVIFEIDPSNNSFTKKYDFDGTSAGYPYGNFTEICVTPPPAGNSAQSFCGAATIADLVATGTNVQWYSASTGSSVLNSMDALIDGSKYYAVQTLGCESKKRLEVTVTITICAGLDEKSQNKFSVYPNPNTGNFTVAFGQQLNNANINVKDVLGKTVYTTTISGDKHNVQFTQAKGIYFVNIQTEQGERTTLKLVVE
jgi:uncharacterized repeat protein (TIGR03803 family)